MLRDCIRSVSHLSLSQFIKINLNAVASGILFYFMFRFKSSRPKKKTSIKRIFVILRVILNEYIFFQEVLDRFN